METTSKSNNGAWITKNGVVLQWNDHSNKKKWILYNIGKLTNMGKPQKHDKQKEDMQNHTI
jgi:uncharacterized Rmd1/YagE family protein